MVEALVAIAVLTIGVVTPLSMLANSLANADFAKNQITAFFLAQEGQELVINKRDNNRLDNKLSGVQVANDSNYWLAGMGPCIDVNTRVNEACDVDTQQPDDFIDVEDNVADTDCNLDKGCRLFLDENGFYTPYGPDNSTIFYRKILILPDEEAREVSDRGAEVIVTISWQDRQKARTFTLKSLIYRWKTLPPKMALLFFMQSS